MAGASSEPSEEPEPRRQQAETAAMCPLAARGGAGRGAESPESRAAQDAESARGRALGRTQTADGDPRSKVWGLGFRV